MKTFDLMYWMNHRYPGAETGAGPFLWLLLCALALGLLKTIDGAFGTHVVKALVDVYPFAWNEIPNSIFNKRAGVAVLFCFPVGLCAYLIAFPKQRVAKVLADFDAMYAQPPRWCAPFLSMGLLVPVFLGSVPIGPMQWTAFPLQIALLALFEFVVARPLLR